MAHPLWPLFDLRLRSERLELRLATDDELADLCAVAEAGIHPPEEMPFAFPWTDTPPAEFGGQFVQYHWRTRGAWRVAFGSAWPTIERPPGSRVGGSESRRAARQWEFR